VAAAADARHDSSANPGLKLVSNFVKISPTWHSFALVC
jgi:hypothetical protein